jgi:hypothetical protein
MAQWLRNISANEDFASSNITRERKAMKKFLATLLMMAMMAIALPTMADAQTRRSVRTRTTRVTTVKKPSFYRRHRNLINIGIGTGAGALLGGLIGGKKGALIGAAAGAGGSALYTYKIKPKQRRYYRR